MSRIGNYFYNSSFMRLLASTVGDEKATSLNKILVTSIPKSETEVEVKGLINLTEKVDESVLNDEIDFKCCISWDDVDSLSVITSFSVNRLESGEVFDEISLRDPLYEMPFRDGTSDFVCEEYFIMIDGGKRVLHAREGASLFETFELKMPNHIEMGVIADSVKVFDENNYDLEDSAIDEIHSLLPTEDAMALGKRMSTING